MESPTLTVIELLCRVGAVASPVDVEMIGHSKSVVGAGAECVVCSGLRFQLGKNDLWTTHPQVAGESC